MYIPSHFEQSAPDASTTVITQYPFGTLVSVVDKRPFATHLPFLVDADGSRLFGHMARANPHWPALADDPSALVIFQGPHAYVSPSWFIDPGVPTWNYTAVHIYGRFHAVEDPAEHLRILETLTNRYEASQPTPWEVDLGSERIRRMVDATVAFEIAVDERQCKFKLSQNRKPHDRDRIIEALNDAGDENASGIAALMEANR